MKEDCIDSLSPIQVKPKDKRREFRKKDIISKLDPRYLKYEKLILDDIKRRKSTAEKNSLELNNLINNKLMKASILREKFYQKRRLNLKEKHSRINQQRKKSINGSTQKNNILKSKKILSKMVKERRSIDYTCIKESLLSSDSSVFSSDSLSSSSSKEENVNLTENELSDKKELKSTSSNNNENSTSSNNNENNTSSNNDENSTSSNNDEPNKDANNTKIELDNNNSNKISDNKKDGENNSSTNETKENNIVTNITNTKIKKEPIQVVVKHVHRHSHSHSRKNSKNNAEKSEVQLKSISHHFKHHHHHNDPNKKKLNEISTGNFFYFSKIIC